MQVASMHFKETAHVKLNDARLQHNLKKMQGKFVAKRRASLVELDDFEGTRDAGKAIRNRALENLDVWLETFERNATARGATVLWAETPADVNALVLEIAAKHAVKKIIKSKSMVSEESALDHAIEAAGMKVVETDLGEYILQINDYEPPSHIIGPALHKSKEEVAELFHKAHGTPVKTGIEELCREARGVLRQHYLTADMGISGGNFFVAETGSVVVVTNEGNATLTTTLPKVHVGDLRHREDRADARGRRDADASPAALVDRAVDLELRRHPHRHEGRRRVPRRRAHVLHPGRQRSYRGARERRARGAALHSLRRVHEPLSGLPERRRPLVRLGLSRPDRLDPHADVRRARQGAGPSGGIHAVQPVRRRLSGPHSACRTSSASSARRRSRPDCDRGTSAPASRCGRGPRAHPALYGFGTKLAVRAMKAWGGRDGMIHKLPVGGGWTEGRDLPAPEGRTFRELYRGKAQEKAS